MSVKRKIIVKGLARKLVTAAFLLFGFQMLAHGCGAQAQSGNQNRKATIAQALLQELAADAERVLYDVYMPSLSFSRGSDHETYWILQEQIESVLPIYGYVLDDLGIQGTEEGLRDILPAEAREESSGNDKGNDSVKDIGKDSVALISSVNSLSLGDLMQLTENTEDSSLEELLRAENEAALQMWQDNGNTSNFQPHTILTQVDLRALGNYETLLKEFYTVDSNTMVGSDQLDLSRLLAKDMTVSKDSQGPQILIYHTHSQEAFADSIPGDDTTGIQGVGEHLTQILQDTYGYQVLHHTGEYDVKSRDNAYSNALPAIEQLLAENPSIQVVIDLHRDEMPETTRLVMDVDGRPTARFMFFNGLSRTRTTGDISYLYNENLEDNLAFSFQMQLKAAQYYPGLTRKIYLKGYRYNMHLSPKYLLIELGAQNNTLEEAMNACDPLAHILDMVLSGE